MGDSLVRQSPGTWIHVSPERMGCDIALMSALAVSSGTRAHPCVCSIQRSSGRRSNPAIGLIALELNVER